MKAPVGCAVLAFALAACSGGNSAIPPASPPGAPSHVKITVKFKVAVPSVRRWERLHRHRRIAPRLKHIWSMAENTAGIQVVQYASGDRTTPLGTAVADISQGSSNCGVTDPYGGRSCSFSLQAVSGNDDFVATTYDKAPVSGSIPAGANQLGYGVATQTITAGTTPTVSLSISGVLAKIELAVTPSSIHTIIPSRATLNVYGKDADDDVIVSNGYIDANGNTVHVTLAVDNTLPLSGSSAASLTVSPPSITAPQPAGVGIFYAPTTNGIIASSTQTVNVTATTDSSAVTTTGAVLKAFPPTYATIADTNLNTANPYHGGMTEDSYGAVYYSTAAGFGGISYYAGTGPSVSNYAATSGNDIKGSIGANPTSAFYAITGTVVNTFCCAPPPALTPVANTSPAPAQNGSGVTYDATRGVVWYASGTNLEAYPVTGGPPASYAISTTTIGGLTLDSSDNVWIVDTANNKLIKDNTVTPTPVSLQAGGAAFDVADQTNLSALEALFVTDHSSSPAIVEVGTGATVLNTLALPSGTAPYYIARDTLQTGILWFDYLSGSKIGIGRIDMNGVVPTFLMFTGPAGTPTSGSVQAGAIGTASDGKIYTVFDNASAFVQWIR